VPKARERAGAFAWSSVQAAWQTLRMNPVAGLANVESHPSAIRMVACAPDENAFKLRAAGYGGPHGALTGELARLLREPGSEALTWHGLIGLLRPAVMDLVASQRPEAEGSVDRYLFHTRGRQAVGVLPVIVAGNAAFLEGAPLFGAGDTYAIVAASGIPEHRSRSPLSTPSSALGHGCGSTRSAHRTFRRARKPIRAKSPSGVGRSQSFPR
jgi:hypothetical protein